MSDPIFWKNKKNITNFSSAESAHSMVSVNLYPAVHDNPTFANSVDPDQMASQEAI